MCVCVCVCEREREFNTIYMYKWDVCVCVYAHTCVWVLYTIGASGERWFLKSESGSLMEEIKLDLIFDPRIRLVSGKEFPRRKSPV